MTKISKENHRTNPDILFDNYGRYDYNWIITEIHNRWYYIEKRFAIDKRTEAIIPNENND